MKNPRNPAVGCFLLVAVPAVLIGAAWLYLFIPRSIGEVRIDRIGVAPGTALIRLDDDLLHESERPKNLLRIEISSASDLHARAFAVSGSNNRIYAYAGPCSQSKLDVSWRVRGPYPDDLSIFSRDTPLRHAVRKPDNRYHYTLYVAMNAPMLAAGDFCFKRVGAKYFSPHAESRIVRVPAPDMQRVLKGVDISDPRAEPL